MDGGPDILTGHVDNTDFSVFRGKRKIRSRYIHISKECENVNCITQEFLEGRTLTLASDHLPTLISTLEPKVGVSTEIT